MAMFRSLARASSTVSQHWTAAPRARVPLAVSFGDAALLPVLRPAASPEALLRSPNIVNNIPQVRTPIPGPIWRLPVLVLQAASEQLSFEMPASGLEVEIADPEPLQSPLLCSRRGLRKRGNRGRPKMGHSSSKSSRKVAKKGTLH
mmetsp:Transcript_1096/g.2392  ORF Transcript_1096/g.2392 Transcript_1096/m.2392 type:complete len:146 (-) Transcript_1096:86-523(-)